MTASRYHYTESGLDNIWLASGFDYVDGAQGRHVVIKDIDGLHETIGRSLVSSKKNLSGREFRFLRQEMLMSQATLAKLMEVSEQAVHRWENGKTGQVPKPAEALIRFLYLEHIEKEDALGVRASLQKLADLEDGWDQMVLRRKSNKNWEPELLPEAA